jgi:hypothetical protein
LTPYIESEIREYIREHDGTTINRVADHMTRNGICSYVTTLNKVNNLIDKRIVEDRKEGNSFHRLYINDKNDFNIIDNQLNEIENALNLMDKPIRKIISQRFGTRAQDETFEFREKYDSFFTGMLRILLEYTAYKIRSEKHSQMLYDRIVKLILKLDSQFRRSDRNAFVYHNFYGFEEDLNDYLKKLGVDAKLIGSLTTLSKNFKQILFSS